MAKHRLIYAAACGKQRLYMLPDPHLVVVRFGESEFYCWKDVEFLAALLADLAEYEDDSKRNESGKTSRRFHLETWTR